MTDWTAGYVADIGYTFGYYQELNPLRVKLAFLNAGLAVPEFGSACELGYGQGMSANLHAAASVTSWHGTDFNPSQARSPPWLDRNPHSRVGLGVHHRCGRLCGDEQSLPRALVEQHFPR